MTKTLLATTIVTCLATTGAFAKAHDQGQTDVPGQSVGSETVAGAHTLGGARGNRPDGKGPKDSPAVKNAGR